MQAASLVYMGLGIARTLAGLGINVNLAPVADVDANPDNPIIRGKGRSFSSDPESVARHAAAFARARCHRLRPSIRPCSPIHPHPTCSRKRSSSRSLRRPRRPRSP